jgi:hypothetical protein
VHADLRLSRALARRVAWASDNKNARSHSLGVELICPPGSSEGRCFFIVAS